MPSPAALPRPTVRGFGPALLAWHATAGRDLVIRRATDPWAVLVAEVMSQQTQVARIGPAWERFVARWPVPSALAVATTHELLGAWAGLGYNRRALALREAARAIVRDHEGRVPATVAQLEALPGIGPYTARAVAATAFGVPVAPLDVNVRRVVGRVLGPGIGDRDLQAAADRLVAGHDPRAWGNAAMDLAATVCTPRAPACDACPLRAICVARRSGDPRRHGSELAGAPRRRAAPRFESTSRWLRGRLLAALREVPAGAWFEPPERLGEHGPPSVAAALAALEREGFVELDDGRARIADDAGGPGP